MNNLITKINQWADNRGLKQADPLAHQLDLDVAECLGIAYDEIKNRKGKMINGTFIKEEDL